MPDHDLLSVELVRTGGYTGPTVRARLNANRLIVVGLSVQLRPGPCA